MSDEYSINDMAASTLIARFGKAREEEGLALPTDPVTPSSGRHFVSVQGAPHTQVRARVVRLLRTIGLSLSIGCCALVINAPAAAADLVTRATDLADQYGDGLANWRTLAIMHRAMHDAANAVLPTYDLGVAAAQEAEGHALACVGGVTDAR